MGFGVFRGKGDLNKDLEEIFKVGGFLVGEEHFDAGSWVKREGEKMQNLPEH